MENERENFASRLGFILVSAGCAIGIGNVWKFPYLAGANGGAAFILIYLVICFFSFLFTHLTVRSRIRVLLSPLLPFLPSCFC